MTTPWIQFPAIGDINSGKTTRDAQSAILTNLELMFGSGTPEQTFLLTDSPTFAGFTVTSGGSMTLGGVARTSWPTGSGVGAFTDSSPNAFYNGGKVGIGTASPTTVLNLKGTGASLAGLTVQADIAFDGSQATDVGGGMVLGTGTTRYAGLYGASESGTQAGYLSFYVRPAAGNLAEYMRIDKDGNVGIGTDSPFSRFNFAGPWLTISSNSPGINLIDANGANKNRYINNNSGLFEIGASNDDGTSPTTQLAIDFIGNVGIGTTTFGTSAAGSLAIGNGTAPTTSIANQIEIFSVDIAAAATIGIRTEAAVAVDVDETKFSDKLPVKINGTDYFIMLTQT